MHSSQHIFNYTQNTNTTFSCVIEVARIKNNSMMSAVISIWYSFIYRLFNRPISSSNYNSIRASQLSHNRWMLVTQRTLKGAVSNEQTFRWPGGGMWGRVHIQLQQCLHFDKRLVRKYIGNICPIKILPKKHTLNTYPELNYRDLQDHTGQSLCFLQKAGQGIGQWHLICVEIHN